MSLKSQRYYKFKHFKVQSLKKKKPSILFRIEVSLKLRNFCRSSKSLNCRMKISNASLLQEGKNRAQPQAKQSESRLQQ